jgi:hypothetical protein
MEIIIEGELLKPQQVGPLLNEADELTKVFSQSRISASRTPGRTVKRQSSNRQSAIGNRQ